LGGNGASKSKYRSARRMALSKLHGDVDALKNLAKLSKYKDTREGAHRIISTPEVFKEELTRILG